MDSSSLSPLPTKDKFGTFGGIAQEYAYATEVNLATLEGLLMTKKAGVGKIRRQRGICVGMILVTLNYLSEAEIQSRCVRLKKIVALIDRSSLDVPGAILSALQQYEAR